MYETRIVRDIIPSPDVFSASTQIYLHVVFAISGRACVIQPKREEEFEKYIGIISGRNQKLIAKIIIAANRFNKNMSNFWSATM